MPIDTNLNVSPYFDDFDETKNFHKVLFRPSVAVQARELTQLQTILQNQIERFGDNIFRIGTVIKGCSLSTDYSYYYIKILDNQADGQLVDMASYANTLLIQPTSNLNALVVNYKIGLESQNPDLNTLFVKYLNTGVNGEKTFANNELITMYDRDRTVEYISVDNGGTLYSNSDTVVITGTGSGATASLTTYANGTIREVVVLSKGSGYTSVPTVTVTTSTGSSANLVAQIYKAQIRVANSTFTAPVGVGSAVKTTEGVIYQKGHFIRVEAQEEVLSKYTTAPADAAVGFAVQESFVNSSIDTSLLDNAAGSTNFSAPGANRLRLSPVLTVTTREEAASNTNFLALLEFENGNIVKDRTRTEFNSINDELSLRTFEESGNYVVSQFPLSTAAISGNTTHFNLNVGSGLAYVDGNRVEVLNNIKIPVRKGIDTANSSLQTISTVYGSYVVVNQMMGAFNIKNGTTVSLRSVAGTDVTDNYGGTPTTPGLQIGTAKFRSLEYDSGTPGTPTCRYRLYLFDIKMAKGYAFESVRSVCSTGTAIADIVLEGGLARLQDFNNDTLVFNSGTVAVREFNNETFVFRTSSNSSFLTSGNLSISFSSGNTLPYGVGQLTSTFKNGFVVIPTATMVSSSNKSGTVSTANATTTNVSGTSTLFTVEYREGDYIKIGSAATPKRIVTIYNDALMAVSSAPGNINSNVHSISYPAGIPINFNSAGKVIDVTSNTGLTLSLGHGISSTTGAVVYHDMMNYEPAVKQKTVSNPVYVKISQDALKRSLNGPWSLGIPDVFEISGVYVGSGATYANTSSTNYKDSFTHICGQTDNYYGLSSLQKKPGTGLSLSTSSNLLIELKCFTHGAGKYISTESYPVDDSSSYDPAVSIKTEEIPTFISPTTGEAYALRDVVDFRPIVANTAVLASSPALATVDPIGTETLVSGEKFFPSPSRNFQAVIQSYLPRVDRVVMSPGGDVRVIEGVASVNPSAPAGVRGSMDLGVIRVAPYPSLSEKEASDVNRPELANSIRLTQTRRYTMQDIGTLEERLQRLEYYTSLSMLESNTKNLAIASEANSSIERFKNGFFVDPFSNYDISNIDDPEYNAFIDTTTGMLSPLKEVSDVVLKYDSGGKKTSDLITLPYAQETLISQAFANRERTLVEQFWSYKGQMKVVPAFDNFFDPTITATSAINVDIATPLESLVSAVNKALSKVVVSSSLVNSSTVIGNWTGGTVQTRNVTVTDTFSDTKNKITSVPSSTSTMEVGSFLTNVNINPFIRAQRVFFIVSGLRPGAEHYVFFDGEELTGSCLPAQVDSGDFAAGVTEDSFVITGNAGSPLVANSSGYLAVSMDIPGGRFNSGEKSILVMDFDNLASESSATSKAIGKFTSFSMAGDATKVTFSTKSFNTSSSDVFDTVTYANTRVVTTTSTQQRVINPDPITQTFRVQPQVEGGDVIFLTSVDLYFSKKDPLVGLTLELREVDSSGYPTTSVLPFSRTYKTSDQVNVSANASTKTTFTFEAPVCVTAGREYAIVVIPDANSPEYRLWTAETGLADVADSTSVMNQSWGLGTLFYSVSGSVFNAIQNEDMKFAVKYAKFSSLSDTITLTNGDMEYLTVAGAVGTFSGGERVAQLGTSYINTKLTTNSSSRVISTSSDITATVATNDWLTIVSTTSNSAVANVSVSGSTVTNTTSASFTTDFTVGDFVMIGNSTVNEIRQVISIANNTQLTLDASVHGTYTNHTLSSIAPVFDVVKVVSANATSITVNRTPKANSSSISSFQKTVTGKVSLYTGDEGKLHLDNSTAANTNFLFRAANSSYYGAIVGGDSGARASVTGLSNIGIVSFKPLINFMILKGTSMTVSGSFVDGANNTYSKAVLLSNDNEMDFDEQLLIRSKSNEITGTTVNKSLTLELDMSSSRNDTSPVIDINPSSLIVSSYIINNSDTNEHTRFGDAQAKYVSKRLVLAEGLDAEDVRVYMAAYKPVGTDIRVYARVLSSTDGDLFEDKQWSELVQTSPNVYSSSLDKTDLREFEFTFKQSPESYELPGTIATYSNSTIVGSNVFWNSTFNANANVDDVNDFITLSGNKFANGDVITYLVEDTNTAIAALSSPTFKTLGTVSVNAAGSGYVSGDVVYLTTGDGGTPAKYAVTANGTGNVTALSIVSRGLYSTLPTLSGSPTEPETGTGTGLTINITTTATYNGPFHAVQANSSGIKLSYTEGGDPIDLVKGNSETGHYLTVLTAGDLVKVVKSDTDTDYEIFPVSAVVNNNIILSGDVSHTTSGIRLEKVTRRGEAFKYPANPSGNNVVRYYNSDLTPFDSYKVLAIKIVLLSEDEVVVPMINDVRALALSV